MLAQDGKVVAKIQIVFPVMAGENGAV